jgi:dolichol kinase
MNAPMVYDVFILILEMIYSLFIVVSIDYFVKNNKISRGSGRKLVHLLMGGIIPFWFLYKSAYAEIFFSIVPLIFIAIIVLATFGKGSHKKNVARLTWTGNIREAVKGPLFFFFMFILITVIGFKSLPGIAALCAMVFGDGIAPFLGHMAKQHKNPGHKSLEGAFGVFIGTLLSSFILYAIFFQGISIYPYIMLIFAGVFAAIIEFFTPSSYDNLTVPLFVFILLFILQFI